MKEWVTSHLVSLLSRPGPASLTCEAVRLVVLMLQYTPLAHLRAEVCRVGQRAL
jgi:hypothetical protein